MKTIIEIAREAGFNKNDLAYLHDNFIRLVELVRADEREACAKLCEVNHHTIRRNMDSFECAAAIRARGQS